MVSHPSSLIRLFSPLSLTPFSSGFVLIMYSFHCCITRTRNRTLLRQQCFVYWLFLSILPSHTKIKSLFHALEANAADEEIKLCTSRWQFCPGQVLHSSVDMEACEGVLRYNEQARPTETTDSMRRAAQRNVSPERKCPSENIESPISFSCRMHVQFTQAICSSLPSVRMRRGPPHNSANEQLNLFKILCLWNFPFWDVPREPLSELGWN
jgi:hypothetical protein